MPYRCRVLTAICVGAILIAVTSCSSSSGDLFGSTTGSVNILLTDAPLDLSTVSAVNVTIGEVTLYAAEDDDGDSDDDTSGMPMRLAGAHENGPFTVNLLDFQNGRTVMLASLGAPAGDYSKLRMEVLAAELVHDADGDPATDDVVEPILVPSGKVKIPVPFTLSRGDAVDVTLDFDAALSVKVNTTNGQHPYILRPVINAMAIVTR